MRLLNIASLQLEEFVGLKIPPYVILSHTWGDEEVLFDDIQGGTAALKRGYAKVKGCCQKAAEDGFEWVWIDTCCIQKSSSAELSEAINSMYEWYQKSTICYAYLQDVTTNPPSHPRVPPSRLRTVYDNLKISAAGITGEEERLEKEIAARLRQGPSPSIFAAQGFSKSRWFTRGWTLQELIAPKVVEFYTSEWVEIGTKRSLTTELSAITGIPSRILQGESPSTCSIAERMSWASTRQTRREEDLAYCLLGLFGVNLPLLYGEGKKSFLRLQEQIMKQEEDYSIFAWSLQKDCAQSLNGLLASTPSEFSKAVPPGLQLPTLQLRVSGSDKVRYLKIDTFASQFDVSSTDFYTSGSWYQVLYTKNYDLLQKYNPQRHSFSEIPQEPPELTSRGLRVSLPLRKPKDPSLPSVAWIYCEIEGRLLCILLHQIDSSRLYGRHSAPWLMSVDKSFLSEFVLTELFLHPNGALGEPSSSSTLIRSSLDPWGRIKVKLPDTNVCTTYVISAYPTPQWSVDEFFFRDEPPVIGVLLFECIYGYQATRFVVRVGVYKGYPWCEIQEALSVFPTEQLPELSTFFVDNEVTKPEFFVAKSDRSAVFTAMPPRIAISAAIRRSPSTEGHITVYTLRVVACVAG